MQPPSIHTARGLRFALGMTLAGVLASLMFVAPAAAAPPLPDPKVVYASDTYAKLQCRFTVTSANYALGTVRGRVTTKISWNGAAGFTNLAEVSVDCIVGDLTTFTDIVHVGRFNVAGRAAYKSEIVTVPLSTAGYYICVQGDYRLKSGIPGHISTTCAV
jgi:hypothetical protein